MYREFKFVVQTVLLVEEGGKVTGEQTADPVVVYGIKSLRQFCDRFQSELENLNKEQ